MSLVIMRPPAGLVGSLVEGSAANYTPNADGTISVSSYLDVRSLLNAGWTVDALGSTFLSSWKVASLAVAVGQTLNTDGAATPVGPASGSAAMTVDSMAIVFGGTFGSETVTVTFKMTYSDGTTATTTYTATGTGTTTFTNAQLAALASNGLSIKSISVTAKSSLAAGSSIATVALTGSGLNL